MTNTKGHHKPIWYQIQSEAEDLLMMLSVGETSYGKLEKHYSCRAETIRLAVIEAIGKEKYQQFIKPGRGKGIGKMAPDAQIARQLYDLRRSEWWECVACAWDTRDTDNPAIQPDKCPKCSCIHFESRRTPLATAFHQVRK